MKYFGLDDDQMLQVGDPISKTVNLKINGEKPENKTNRRLSFAFINPNHHPAHVVILSAIIFVAISISISICRY